MERLTDRRILITGAASGIGRATALRLLAEGARVMAADVAEEGLKETLALADSDRLTMRVLDGADAHQIQGRFSVDQ
ncbi:SDR family NAD(P)-dependent oxidoreductase [Nonomuraea angiospora]|uniref:SDR family NAD(P)-dependent oxidoreductase n=1 Tax=Nonomuraea angiospora TaxID=46172 RepID=UPI003F5523E8